jgi:hypothetical protein
MINRKIEDIAEIDIQTLISNGEEESQTLDFKQALPGNDSVAKHEFYADICAFANTQGGDIVYGVSEDADGRAGNVIPLADNPDVTALRLQDMAMNGIEPKITGIHVRAVPVAGGNVFIARVPRSVHAPHRVKTNQHFFIREGCRKRPLDVPEVGAAFSRATNAAERIRNFRLERIGRIMAGDAPVRLFDGVIAVLHVVPLQPSAEAGVDPTTYHPERQERRLPVISGTEGLGFRLNLDGGLAHRAITKNGCGAYTLIFRDGKIEAVRVFDFQSQNGLFSILSDQYELEILNFMREITQELQRLKLGPPFVVMYSLLHAKNGCLSIVDEQWFRPDLHPKFDRDILAFPEIILDQIEQLDVALRPMFDLVWQSVNVSCSPNYNKDGVWVGKT